MQTVGRNISPRRHHFYIREYDVPGKIARHLAAGTFHEFIQAEADRLGLKVRKMREPGTLARLRTSWSTAANCAHFDHTGSTSCIALKASPSPCTMAAASLPCVPSSV